MRVVGGGVGVHQRLEHVLWRDLVQPREHTLVALAQRVGRFSPALAGQQQRDRIVFDPQAPELVDFGQIGGPVRVLAIEREALLASPVRFALEQFQRVVHALAIALLEDVEHQIGGVDLTGVNHVAELQSPAVKAGHVAGEKIAVLGIERGQKAIEHLGGEPLVDRDVAVVVLLENAGHARSERALVSRRGNGLLGQQSGGRRSSARARSSEDQQAQGAQGQRSKQLAGFTGRVQHAASGPSGK